MLGKAYRQKTYGCIYIYIYTHTYIHCMYDIDIEIKCIGKSSTQDHVFRVAKIRSSKSLGAMTGAGAGHPLSI